MPDQLDKQTSAQVGRLTCQVCQEAFTNKLDADTHKSLAHDLRRGGTDRPRRFLACRGCNERVFVGDRCQCGVVSAYPTWVERRATADA